MDSCSSCEFYNSEEDTCMAFECNGLDCPELPCECAESEEDANENYQGDH